MNDKRKYLTQMVKASFPDFVKSKSAQYWKVMFFLFAILTIAMTVLFLAIFFVVPNFSMSAYPSTANLPAKYVALLIIGGFGKDWVLGFFTYHAWVEWHRLASVHAQDKTEAKR